MGQSCNAETLWTHSLTFKFILGIIKLLDNLSIQNLLGNLEKIGAFELI